MGTTAQGYETDTREGLSNYFVDLETMPQAAGWMSERIAGLVARAEAGDVPWAS
jgi:hypothetical protein